MVVRTPEGKIKLYCKGAVSTTFTHSFSSKTSVFLSDVAVMSLNL